MRNGMLDVLWTSFEAAVVHAAFAMGTECTKEAGPKCRDGNVYLGGMGCFVYCTTLL